MHFVTNAQNNECIHVQFVYSSDQSLSHVRLFVTPWTAAFWASLSITNSQSLLKLMSIESVMPSNHLILCHPLLLLPSVFPSIRVFSSESVLCISWPKYWSFSFSISPSSEYLGLTGTQHSDLYTYICIGMCYICICLCIYMGFQGDANSKEPACQCRRCTLIPCSGRSPREGNGNSLQCSCLGNPMNRGDWWATQSPWGLKKSGT